MGGEAWKAVIIGLLFQTLHLLEAVRQRHCSIAEVVQHKPEKNAVSVYEESAFAVCNQHVVVVVVVVVVIGGCRISVVGGGIGVFDSF